MRRCSAPGAAGRVMRPGARAPQDPEAAADGTPPGAGAGAGAPPDPLAAGGASSAGAPSAASRKDPTLMQGELRVRSTWGIYRKRHFVLVRPSSVGGDPELREYADATKRRLLSSVRVRECELVSRFGDFVVAYRDERDDDHELELRAKDVEEAEEWLGKVTDAINEADAAAAEAQRKPHAERIAKALAASAAGAGAGAADAGAGATANGPDAKTTVKEGFLQMPSASRFAKWQSRYFRLRGGSLFYYRTDVAAEDDFEGEILVDGARTERSGEKTFLLATDVRTVELLAASPDAANDWMEAIRSVQEKRGTQQGSSRPGTPGHAASEGNTPAWIERWDKQTTEENVVGVHAALDRAFGRKPGEAPDVSKVLSAVTLVIQDLDDKARECLPLNGAPDALTEAGREPRPDIFETLLRFYHLRIVQELSAFLSDQSYESLTVKDLLRFMDLITAYDGKLNEMLQGPLGDEMRETVIFDLPEHANNMAEVYLRKLRGQLKAWTDKIEQDNTRGGAARVEARLDGRLQTPGPTDLFNFLNEALSLAKVSGVRRLQASVVSMCAVSLSDYLFAITNDLENDLNKSESCRYTCAVTNDCWTVLDHLDRLEQEQSAVLAEFSVDLEAVRDKCRTHSTRTLEVLAAQARSDFAPVLAKAFTKSHLESTLDTEDVMAVVVATMDDYLEDFQNTLEPPFVNRVAKMMTRDVCGLYLARLAHAYQHEGLLAMTKRDAELVNLDRKRLIDCLEARFMHIQARKLFGRELAALDDVLDMLLSTPALVPDTALEAASRDPRLRLHVANAAKMCVDLVCNADGSKASDKLAMELKGMVMININEKVQGPREVDAVGWLELERHPYVVMWGPQFRSPNQPTAAQLDKARDHQRRKLEEEQAQFEKKAAPVAQPQVGDREARLKSMQSRQQSTQWRPPPKRAQSTAELAAQPQQPPQNGAPAAAAQAPATAAAAAAPVAAAKAAPAAAQPAAPAPAPAPAAAAAPVVAAAAAGAAAGAVAGAAVASAAGAKPPSGPPGTQEYEPGIKLVFKNPDDKKPAPEECTCALRRISDKSTDLAFFRISSKVDKKTGSNIAFRKPLTELRRVEFWDVAKGPGHFGRDGVVIEDSPLAPHRTANQSIEFCVWTKNGDKLHFTAPSADDATEWVNALKAAFMASYAKWGSTFAEEENYYLGMQVKELKALAKRRGVDLSGCVEKADMARALVKAESAAAAKTGPGEDAGAAAAAKPAAAPVNDGPAVNPFASGSDGPAINPFAKVDQKSSFASVIDGKAAAPAPASAAPPAAAAAAAPPAAPSAPAAAPAAAKQAPAYVPRSGGGGRGSAPDGTSAGTDAPGDSARNRPAPAPTPSPPAAAPTPSPPPAAATAAAAGVGAAAGAGAAAAAAPSAAPRAAPAAAAPPPARLEQNEQALVELQSQIVRGMMLLEEGSPEEAGRVFNLAVARAREMNNTALHARATAGLASAYRDQPRMRKAAAPLFEVAASLFATLNEVSDRINVLNEAADVYASLGQNDRAIAVLQRFDDRQRQLGQPPVFEARIARLKQG